MGKFQNGEYTTEEARTEITQLKISMSSALNTSLFVHDDGGTPIGAAPGRR